MSVSPLHFWHRWTRWTDPVTREYEEGIFVQSLGSYTTWTYSAPVGADMKAPIRTFTYDEQHRHCEVCGKAEMRRV